MMRTRLCVDVRRSKKKRKKRCGPLGDDFQDVEDQLHDHRTLAQLTRPAVDDGDQSTVQVAQVLRQERLAVTSCQVTHLQQWTQGSDWIPTLSVY